MSAWHHLRLITVDLDDTVWPCAPVIREAEAAHYAWLAAQAPRLTDAHDPDSLRAHRREVMAKRPEIAHDVTALRQAALQELLAAHRYPLDLADAALAVFRRARNCVEPYPDVLPVLQRLRRHCRLVSITNGNAEVHETPLRDLFDHSLTAAEAGAAKPAPALFERAMAWAGATATETLHIGDDPFLDIEAARNVGIKAVWINRDARPWPSELAPPVLEAPDLHRLESWLDLPVDAG
jgi:putative hydrolase of the HAD superfamily